jgi:hypothetical protein
MVNIWRIDSIPRWDYHKHRLMVTSEEVGGQRGHVLSADAGRNLAGCAKI